MTGGEVLGSGCWELTAPESYALLHGPRHEHGTQAFKLALIELTAREKISLVIEEKRGVFSRGSIVLLVPGKDRHRPQSRSLTALLDLLDSAGTRVLPDGKTAGVPVAKLVRKARKKYGWPGGYAEAEVMPALAARGFYERRKRKILGLFGALKWEPTASGRRAMEELEEAVSLGYRRFGEWVEEDPEQALRFLGFAGSAALIMRPLHRDIRRLGSRRELTRDLLPDAPDEVIPKGRKAEDVEGDASRSSDATSPVFGSSIYPDLEIFDGLDVSFPAIDSGFTGGGEGLGGHDGGA